jgi:hypothetical protein
MSACSFDKHETTIRRKVYAADHAFPNQALTSWSTSEGFSSRTR